MFHSRLLPAAVVLLATLPCAAQENLRGDGSNRSSVGNRRLPVIGIRRVFGPGTHKLTKQIVIPNSGGNSRTHAYPNANPAAQAAGVFGRGATSTVLSFSDAAAKTGALITTEDYGVKPVFTGEVSGVTVKGPDSGVFSTEFPYNKPDEAGPGELIGVKLDAVEAIVDNCHIRMVGTGITLTHSAASGYWGHEYRASNNRIVHCITGIQACTDMRIMGNYVQSCRDYCLYLPTNAGAVQSTGNHYYGAQKAVFAENAEGFHSVNDVFSDAGHGLHLTGYSHYATVTGGYSQHCWERNIDCESEYASFVNTSVRVARESDQHPDIVGVEFSALGCQFIGGSVVLSDFEFSEATHERVPVGSTAFKISGGDNHKINTVVTSQTFPGGNDYDDVALEIIHATFGCDITINIPRGFKHADTRLLVIADDAAATMRANTITFRGANLEDAVANPAKFIDIGGRGLAKSNTVRIIDTDSASEVTLSVSKTY